MLIKSCCVALGALIAGSSALFNDVETGSQPGKKNHCLYLKVDLNENYLLFL